MRSILKRLSRRHSTAVAYLALFAALGGSAYAAVTVTGKNIKDGTITGKDVKNRSLGRSKLSATAVSSLTGQRGPAGPQGPSGVSGWEYRVSPGTYLPSGGGRAQVSCPGGKKALGGGASNTDSRSVIDSAPTDGGTGWAIWYSEGSRPSTVYAWVICANVTS